VPAALPTTPTPNPTQNPSATNDHGPGIEAVAAIVGDRWSMLIVRNVFRGIRRFDALHDDLGVSRPVLAGRLKRLVEAGILERTRYQDHPPRHDYVLTPAGLELSPALVALIRWGDRWFGGDERTAVLVHADCGDEFEQSFWCRTCTTTFGPSEIRSRA
jgi:DNA-binding HxlR family transcriptional regulator